MFRKFYFIYFLLILILILSACQGTGTPLPVVETQVVTEVVEATPVEVIQVVTPTPEPEGPRTLVICLGDEPEGISPYIGSSGVDKGAILEAVFGGQWWGAVDFNSYAYQPILQGKLPTLADGDAEVTDVIVREGDTVVDANGNVEILMADADPPIRLIPSGGGEPVPYAGGEFKMDQVSATYKLQANLIWSDGEPLTASDSVYAFNLMADPENTLEYFPLDRTASYEAIDTLTTVWIGLPGFLDFEHHFFGPVPEHLLGGQSIQQLLDSDEYNKNPIGWGPYIIDDWIDGDSIILNKNPNYFRATEGLPKFETLVFRFIGQNINANLAALLSGECDILSATTGIEGQIELLLDLQRTGQIRASFTPGETWEHIDFGIQPREYDDGYRQGADRPDFFSDVQIRQAFALCMDRQALIDKIFNGQSLIWDSNVPPQHPLHNPDVRQYPFDVAAGSALLEKSGWVDDDEDPETPRIAQGVANVPDGTRLEVGYETTSSILRQQVSTIIKDSLAQCGIRANIQLTAAPEFFADPPEGIVFGRHFDLSQFAWGISWCGHYLSNEVPGPEGKSWVSILDGLERVFVPYADGFNVPGFVNSRYDAACSTILSSIPGESRYQEAYLETQQIFAENLPAIPLFPRIRVAATRPDMCGFIVDPTGGEMWNIEEFDYGEGCEG